MRVKGASCGFAPFPSTWQNSVYVFKNHFYIGDYWSAFWKKDHWSKKQYLYSLRSVHFYISVLHWGLGHGVFRFVLFWPMGCCKIIPQPLSVHLLLFCLGKIFIINYYKLWNLFFSPQEKHGLSFLTDLELIGLLALGSKTSNWICMLK